MTVPVSTRSFCTAVTWSHLPYVRALRDSLHASGNPEPFYILVPDAPAGFAFAEEGLVLIRLDDLIPAPPHRRTQPGGEIPLGQTSEAGLHPLDRLGQIPGQGAEGEDLVTKLGGKIFTGGAKLGDGAHGARRVYRLRAPHRTPAVIRAPQPNATYQGERFVSV